MFLVSFFLFFLFSLNSVISVRKHSDGNDERYTSKWLKPDGFQMLLHNGITWGSLKYTGIWLPPNTLIRLQWGESWALGFLKVLSVILMCGEVWETLDQTLRKATNKEVQDKENLEKTSSRT